MITRKKKNVTCSIHHCTQSHFRQKSKWFSRKKKDLSLKNSSSSSLCHLFTKKNSFQKKEVLLSDLMYKSSHLTLEYMLWLSTTMIKHFFGSQYVHKITPEWNYGEEEVRLQMTFLAQKLKKFSKKIQPKSLYRKKNISTQSLIFFSF